MALAMLGLTGPAALTAQTLTAVEYYYAEWNYYFVTAFPDEIALLDGGAFGGVWKRTGQTFVVWTDASSGALPTCRFFSTNFAPKSSHFYTPYAAECSTLTSNHDWQYESIAFYLRLPDANGNCAPGTTTLFRLYNNGMGGAPNHRFTTDASTFNQMRIAGWTFEGNGLTGTFACVPRSSAASTMAGFWSATVGPNEVDGIVLEDGTFYFVYSASSSVDLVQGTANAASGQFSSADAIDIRFGLVTNTSNASFAGTYVPQRSLNGTISSASLGTLSFSASYDPSFMQPANMAEAAGAYSGLGETPNGVGLVSLTLSATGAFSGTTAGLGGNACSFTGMAIAHGNVDLFDLSMKLSETGCELNGATISGIAGYDGEGGLLVIAVAPDRTHGLVFTVSKS